MPTDYVRVHRVDKTQDKGGQDRFLITAWHADGRLGGLQVDTYSEYAASLADQARKRHLVLAIKWKDLPPWKNLVDAWIVEKAKETA